MYRVCERKEDSPVYVVEAERGGERRTVHRNMLFHCGEELPDMPVADTVCQQTKNVSRKGKEAAKSQDNESESDENSDLDAENAPIPRSQRNRQKKSRLQYSTLGNPTDNILQTVPKEPDSYRVWLQQLWNLGFMTDLLIKQRFATRCLLHEHKSKILQFYT